MVKFDGHDAAIIGYASVWDSTGALVERLIYSGEALVDALVRDGMTPDEAHEWISFNMEGAYVGESTPVVMWPWDEEVWLDAQE